MIRRATACILQQLGEPGRGFEEARIQLRQDYYQMKKIGIANWNELEDRTPAHALVADVDLVIVRYDDNVGVLYVP